MTRHTKERLLVAGLLTFVLVLLGGIVLQATQDRRCAAERTHAHWSGDLWGCTVDGQRPL